MRRENPGRDERLPSMRITCERRTNWASLRSAKGPAAGRHPRGPRAFRVTATPGFRRFLVASGRLLNRYRPHFSRFRFDRIFLPIHFH